MAANPPSLSSALGSLVGENSPGQMALYAIVQAMVQAAIAPFVQQLEHISLSKVPIVPLSPAQLADMVNRALMDQASAQSEAQFSGINAARFASLVQASGESPGVDVLARALRLGIIPPDSKDANTPGFVQGVQQSRVRNMWTSMLSQVARAYPSPELFVEAWLRGQTDEATARATYEKLGGVPEFFDPQFNVAGRPPTPNEVAEMVHRGIVPKPGIGAGVLSYDQSVRESDLKDKWGDALFELSVYLPPPRTVVALVRAGTLDDATALTILQQSGVSADLAASYVGEAHHTKTLSDRQLAKQDILTLYNEQVLSVGQATTLLEGLHYTAEDATFLLEMVNFRRELTAINAAVVKFQSLYINHRISYNEAVTGLDHLGIVANQRDHLIATWTLERQANVKVLTPAEIRKAHGLGLLDDATATTRLVDDGYSPSEAALYLQL